MKEKSFTIHDLPKSERPRERFIQFGSENLSVQGKISDCQNIFNKEELRKANGCYGRNLRLSWLGMEIL